MDEYYTSYSEIHYIKNIDYPLPIKNIKNFTIFNKNSKKIFLSNILEDKKEILEIKNNAFIFVIDNLEYFHVIADKIFQYEFLKTYITDLKIYFVSLQEREGNDITLKNRKYMNDIFKIYNQTSEDIIYIQDKSTCFKNYYYIYNNSDSIFTGLPNINSWHYYTNPIHYKNIYKKYEHLLSKNKNKKIYISRKKASKDWENKLKENPEHNMFLKIWFERFYPIEWEEKIENFFIEKGYEIVYLEDLGFIEQINLFYNSTHIAMTQGTGVLNIIFTRKNTKIFILNNIAKYRNPSWHIIKGLNKNINEVFNDYVEELDFYDKISPATIIRELQNNYLDDL